MDKDPRTFAIIGAAFEVHRVLGPGFLEAVYQEAFAKELQRRGIPFESERPSGWVGYQLRCPLFGAQARGSVP